MYAVRKAIKVFSLKELFDLFFQNTVFIVLTFIILEIPCCTAPQKMMDVNGKMFVRGIPTKEITSGVLRIEIL